MNAFPWLLILLLSSAPSANVGIGTFATYGLCDNAGEQATMLVGGHTTTLGYACVPRTEEAMQEHYARRP